MQRLGTPWLSLCTTAVALAACARAPAPANVSVAALQQDAQAPTQITYNPLTGRPSFIRGRIPLSALGLRPSDTSQAAGVGFMKRYATMFGVDTSGQELQVVDSRTDSLGMRHLRLQQVAHGIPVYDAAVSVHLAPQGEFIAAVSSNVVPDIQVSSAQPAIREDSARATAAAALHHGTPLSSRLVVYPGRKRAAKAILAWLVQVRGDSLHPRTTGGADTIPARRDYLVDASNGRLVDAFDRLYTARDRETYDAAHGTTLPGTLRRSEGTPAVGDADVDHAHDFVGATYDYYKNTHGRDSYDGAGAKLIATVHYGVNYENAFWDGAQMVYGDGFPVLDVTAHELTHAVTERTANLEYRYQSGALNESYSDIFGAMVDRNDWLMGEDMPIGAIRDLEHPGNFNQPGTLSGWVATCSDNEGVHTNSGIPSKAFVNIATAIGKGDAERIFYRALTVYLHPQATLEDARGAALQAAEDLFGVGSSQATAVDNGYVAVGLDGTAQPPASNCGSPIPHVPDLSPAGLVALAALFLLAAAWRARRKAVRA
jgi:Zn-dependent metalloprotease